MNKKSFDRGPSARRFGTAILLALVLIAGLGDRTTRAASLPAHGGSFSCGTDGFGNRTVYAFLPYAKSSLAREQVWWYAIVYRKAPTGYERIGYVRNELLTGYTGPTGMQINYSKGGATWWGATSGTPASTGGGVIVPGAGTYLVAEYFWWASTASSWNGVWATNLLNGATSCSFAQ